MRVSYLTPLGFLYVFGKISIAEMTCSAKKMSAELMHLALVTENLIF